MNIGWGKKIKARFAIDVEVPFFAYDTKKENRLALLQIRLQIEDILEQSCFLV